jgi:hypothetical protein
MDGTVDAREQRTARRLRIAARLVLYPVAIGLIALAWHHQHRPSASEIPDGVHWTGVTSQGQQVEAVTSGVLLTSLDTHLLHGCSDGSSYDQHWFPVQPAFVQYTTAVRARTVIHSRDSTGEPTTSDTTMVARMGSHPSGTIYARVTRITANGSVPCASEDVTFTLSRRR